MKPAGWLSLLISAVLFLFLLNGVREDALAAANGGRDISQIDSNNQAWMMEGLAGGVFLIAGIALIAAGKRPKVVPDDEPVAPPICRPEQSPWAAYDWVEEDVTRKCKNVERLFYAKVAGASHPNDDGSSRLQAIERCEPGDEFRLRTGTAPAYPDSVAVFTEDGAQIGYLDSRLAGEIKRDHERGAKWRCFMQRPTFEPGTQNIVGAALCMVRLEEAA